MVVWVKLQYRVKATASFNIERKYAPKHTLRGAVNGPDIVWYHKAKVKGGTSQLTPLKQNFKLLQG